MAPTDSKREYQYDVLPEAAKAAVAKAVAIRVWSPTERPPWPSLGFHQVLAQQGQLVQLRSGGTDPQQPQGGRHSPDG